MEGINEIKNRIFISSAQSDEGKIKWSEIRKNIKKTLEEKGVFNVFIIEDSCSGTPSEEFMLREVRFSDIVVILIYGEVRKGIKKEYQEAVKLKKKIFIYFREDGLSEEAKKLKEEIHANDIATTGIIKNISTIGEQIYQNLMFEMSTSYLDDSKKETARIHGMRNDLLKPFISAYENIKYEMKILKKTTINEEDYYQKFVQIMQKFLFTGEINLQLEDEKIIKEKIFKGNNLLYERFFAFISYVKNNKEESLKILDGIKDEITDDWLKSNILIDCRNLQDEINKKNGEMFGKNFFQEEIDNSKNFVCFPADDRILNNINENLRKEELKKNSESPMTISFGSSFNECLKLFQDYYFTAILYGSITHILKAREILINILYKYSILYNADEFVYIIFILLTLNGNVKDIKHYNSIFQKEYKIDFTILAEQLWRTSRNTCINQKMTRFSIIEICAMYFSDDRIKEILSYLEEVMPENYIDLAEYLKCIRSIMKRVPAEWVIKIILKLFDRKLVDGQEIAKILLYINFKDTSKDELIRLNEYLLKNVVEIIEKKGTPQFIVNLLNYDKIIFDELYKKIKSLMKEEDKRYFNINMKNDEEIEGYEKIIDDEIEYIQSILEGKEKAIFSSKMNDSVKNINDVIIVEKYNITEKKINKIYYLLANLLKNKKDIGLAEDIIKSLITIVIKCKKLKYKIDFISIEKDFDFENLTNIMWGLGTFSSIDIEMFFLRSLLNKVEKEECDEIYYNYSSYTDYEKTILAETLHKVAPYIEEQLQNFVHLFYIMSADNYYCVRYHALDSLPYFLKYINLERTYKLIDRFIDDENRNVRVTLLNMCKSNKFDEQLKKYILKKLINDIDYEIRENAKE